MKMVFVFLTAVQRTLFAGRNGVYCFRVLYRLHSPGVVVMVAKGLLWIMLPMKSMLNA